jgi:hypothetical protein
VTSGDALSDTIRPFTRWLALVILPFLVAAVVLLYLLPTTTDKLFAWTIAPPLTAMFLGSAYIGGICFFTGVARSRRWHSVRHGFAAVVVFSTLMAVATVLHWDRFHFGHVSFVTWALLYLTTPFLTLAAVLFNWRADPGESADSTARVPWAPRVALGILGLAALAFGLALFLFPVDVGRHWAWEVTPLTGRIVGATLTLPGMVNMWLFIDARWSAFRWIFLAQIASLVFIAIAIVFRLGDLQWTRPAAGLFVAGILVSLAAYSAFFVVCERRARAAGPPDAAHR